MALTRLWGPRVVRGKWAELPTGSSLPSPPLRSLLVGEMVCRKKNEESSAPGTTLFWLHSLLPLGWACCLLCQVEATCFSVSISKGAWGRGSQCYDSSSDEGEGRPTPFPCSSCMKGGTSTSGKERPLYTTLQGFQGYCLSQRFKVP